MFHGVHRIPGSDRHCQHSIRVVSRTPALQCIPSYHIVLYTIFSFLPSLNQINALTMSTTSSSSIQWSLEQPWLPTVCGVSFLTLAIWWWMGQRTRNPPTSQEPSLSYLLIGSLTVIAGSAYLLRGILEDHYDGAFMVVIGASTFIVCTLIHHFSLCIPIVGVAMLMALVHEHLLHGPEVVRQAQLWWGNQTTTERDDAPKHTLLDTVLSLLPTNTAEAIAPYGFGFAVFLFSFLICQQREC